MKTNTQFCNHSDMRGFSSLKVNVPCRTMGYGRAHIPLFPNNSTVPKLTLSSCAMGSQSEIVNKEGSN